MSKYNKPINVNNVINITIYINLKRIIWVNTTHN